MRLQRQQFALARRLVEAPLRTSPTALAAHRQRPLGLATNWRCPPPPRAAARGAAPHSLGFFGARSGANELAALRPAAFFPSPPPPPPG